MLVSWEWLNQYVALKLTPAEAADRWSMSGLNHEDTTTFGNDYVIDLEVTSNRADCLGHIGIAREIAVLTNQPLCIPAAQIASTGRAVDTLVGVENQMPGGCPRYTARVLQGVKIGPSPAWLVRRLAAIGCKSVNNVVDVTNYVMFECGQPLHAFDLKQIRGKKIIIRAAKDGEEFQAIDHRTYKLDSSMVVIADAERAVALGGVMGGVDSEVSTSTVDLLIEAADFTPMNIRRTARALKLHSPSSFRFERRVDQANLDWASRRCCELIQQVAGGTIASGVIDTKPSTPQFESITLRAAQISRVLGIEVPESKVSEILLALGFEMIAKSSDQWMVRRPSWRPDVTREVDLIEEIARIYGYDRIPEDVAVPMTTSAKRPKDVMLERVRLAMSAAGIDEALTPSVVTEELNGIISPWTEQPALRTETPLLEGATYLRRSLIPSLLHCRLLNQSQSIRDAELFETASVYLPAAQANDLPSEQFTLGLVTHRDFLATKGILESMIALVAGDVAISTIDWNLSIAAPGQSAKLTIGDSTIGLIATLGPAVKKQIGLEQTVTVAEVSLDALIASLRLVPTANRISAFPAIVRDLNFVLDEQIRWDRLSRVVTSAGGAFLRDLTYRETYRDTKKDGEGKKRVLISFALQSDERTLTSQEADAFTQSIIKACEQELGGKLFA